MFALSTSGVLAQPKLASSSKRCSAKRAVRAMPMAKMVRLFCIYEFSFFFLFLSVSEENGRYPSQKADPKKNALLEGYRADFNPDAN